MADYDIVIVGGGPAGVGAAVAAAKNGLKTAVVERHSMLGGNWTSGYVLSILGMYTYDGTEKIVGGVADEVVKNLKNYNGTKGKSGNFVPFRPDEMKISLGQLLEKMKVDIYFNAMVTGAEVKSGRVKFVEITDKKGVEKVKSKMFVDSSGDADLVYAAGFKTLSGKEGEGWHQEATIPFRIANVNENDMILFSLEHNDLVTVVVDEFGKLSRLRLTDKLIGKAKSEHEIYLPNANAEFMFSTGKDGEFVCNATHVEIHDFTDSKEIAAAIGDARKQINSSIRFLQKYLHGFENSYLIDSAPSIGLRETRRAVGEYVLKRSDVIGNARFDDAIARCGHPLEIHDPKKGVVYVHLGGGDNSWYNIPYRSIVVKGAKNLFAIGRCLSAEFDAQASARVTGTAMAMGHAASVAASIAIKRSVSAKIVPVKELQKKLKGQGAII